jgi:hypothetical protein
VSNDSIIFRHSFFVFCTFSEGWSRQFFITVRCAQLTLQGIQVDTQPLQDNLSKVA